MSIKIVCPVDNGAETASFVTNHQAKNSIKGGKTYAKNTMAMIKAATATNGANNFFMLNTFLSKNCLGDN